MKFHCQFDYYPQPYEPNFYIREMIIDVVCGTAEGDEVVAGRLAIDHLDIIRADVSGESIYEVCDADSGGGERVFAGLFEPGTPAEWRADFRFDEPICHLLFMHRSVFHPVLRDWQSYIIDHVAKLVGDDSAFVMWRGETDLSDHELARLGFRVIAGEDLRMRPNMYQHDYDAARDDRDVLGFDVPNDVADYVERAWKTDS